MYISISKIIVNKQGVDEEHVDDFVEMIERGWKMPPITVRRVANGYVLVDGRHRLAAHKILGKEVILAMFTL